MQRINWPLARNLRNRYLRSLPLGPVDIWMIAARPPSSLHAARGQPCWTNGGQAAPDPRICDDRAVTVYFALLALGPGPPGLERVEWSLNLVLVPAALSINRWRDSLIQAGCSDGRMELPLPGGPNAALPLDCFRPTAEVQFADFNVR